MSHVEGGYIPARPEGYLLTVFPSVVGEPEVVISEAAIVACIRNTNTGKYLAPDGTWVTSLAHHRAIRKLRRRSNGWRRHIRREKAGR